MYLFVGYIKAFIHLKINNFFFKKRKEKREKVESWIQILQAASLFSFFFFSFFFGWAIFIILGKIYLMDLSNGLDLCLGWDGIELENTIDASFGCRL
jgi:hypothetical protein